VHQSLHILLLIVSFSLLISQLWIRQKQLIHLLFAAFCGSLCLMAIKRLGGVDFGFYQYLLAMGICMTCNGYWLVARALFRPQQAILWRHALVAAAMALLMICSQGLLLLQQFWPESQQLVSSTRLGLNELLNLSSSAILMLTLWEGCRGYAQSRGAERAQRQLFLVAYGGAVALCAVIAKVWLPAKGAALQHEILSSGAALTILVVTQWLIYRRFPQPSGHQTAPTAEPSQQVFLAENVEENVIEPQHAELATPSTGTTINAADRQLCADLQQLLFQDNLFLQPNLRLADLSKQLDAPEYRISKILRTQFHASNFNQFINKLRIEHAITLLSDPTKSHWPVLVVGMESGFASVGPFTRAFKATMGYTPHEFRQKGVG
jgi:AraC-like DNA-binding protein